MHFAHVSCIYLSNLSHAALYISSSISIPINSLFVSLQATPILPLPIVGSRTISPSLLYYFRIQFIRVVGFCVWCCPFSLLNCKSDFGSGGSDHIDILSQRIYNSHMVIQQPLCVLGERHLFTCLTTYIIKLNLYNQNLDHFMLSHWHLLST